MNNTSFANKPRSITKKFIITVMNMEQSSPFLAMNIGSSKATKDLWDYDVKQSGCIFHHGI
jgi:hypothetical protein